MRTKIKLARCPIPHLKTVSVLLLGFTSFTILRFEAKALDQRIGLSNSRLVEHGETLKLGSLLAQNDPNEIVFKDKSSVEDKVVSGSVDSGSSDKDTEKTSADSVNGDGKSLETQSQPGVNGKDENERTEKNENVEVTASPEIQSEKALLRGVWGQHQTTDNYLLTNSGIEFTNHRRDLSYPYGGAKAKAWDYGVLLNRLTGFVADDKVVGERGEIYLGRKFSPQYYLKIAAGAHKLKEKEEEKFHTIGVGTLTSVASLFDHRLYAKFEVSRDFIYQKLALPGGLDKKLWEVKARLDLNLKFHPRWRWVLRGVMADINDENKWRSGESSLLYGISPSSPWVWFGVFGHHLSFRRNRSEYWSPKKFIYYGLELDSSFPIMDDLSFVLAGRWGAFRENDLKTGKGWSVYTGFRLGQRDNINVELYYLEIETKQGESPWRQKSVFVNLNLPW